MSRKEGDSLQGQRLKNLLSTIRELVIQCEFSKQRVKQAPNENLKEIVESDGAKGWFACLSFIMASRTASNKLGFSADTLRRFTSKDKSQYFELAFVLRIKGALDEYLSYNRSFSHSELHEDAIKYLESLKNFYSEEESNDNPNGGNADHYSRKLQFENLAKYPVSQKSGAPWLLFYQENIKFIGREAEIQELEAFTDDDSLFKWLAITGEGGTGKSRLAHHFFVHHMKEWYGGFLERTDSLVEDIKSWQQDAPSFFIIDYANRISENIATIVSELARKADESKHPIRLLILERSASSGDSWWDKLSNQTSRYYPATLGSMFRNPLELSPMGDRSLEFLGAVFEAQTNNCPDFSEREMNTVLRLTDQGRPLYLGILAVLMSDKQEFDITTYTSESDLVEAYLWRELRHWKMIIQCEEVYTNCLKILVLSTMCRGIPIKYPGENLSGGGQTSRGIRALRRTNVSPLRSLNEKEAGDTATKIISDIIGDENIYWYFHKLERLGISKRGRAPLEPDLLGETLVKIFSEPSKYNLKYPDLLPEISYEAIFSSMTGAFYISSSRFYDHLEQNSALMNSKNIWSLEFILLLTSSKLEGLYVLKYLLGAYFYRVNPTRVLSPHRDFIPNEHRIGSSIVSKIVDFFDEYVREIMPNDENRAYIKDLYWFWSTLTYNLIVLELSRDDIEKLIKNTLHLARAIDGKIEICGRRILMSIQNLNRYLISKDEINLAKNFRREITKIYSSSARYDNICIADLYVDSIDELKRISNSNQILLFLDEAYRYQNIFHPQPFDITYSRIFNSSASLIRNDRDYTTKISSFYLSDLFKGELTDLRQSNIYRNLEDLCTSGTGSNKAYLLNAAEGVIETLVNGVLRVVASDIENNKDLLIFVVNFISNTLDGIIKQDDTACLDNVLTYSILKRKDPILSIKNTLLDDGYVWIGPTNEDLVKHDIDTLNTRALLIQLDNKYEVDRNKFAVHLFNN